MASTAEDLSALKLAIEWEYLGTATEKDVNDMIEKLDLDVVMRLLLLNIWAHHPDRPGKHTQYHVNVIVIGILFSLLIT